MKKQDRRYSDPKARNGKQIIGQKIFRKIKILQKFCGKLSGCIRHQAKVVHCNERRKQARRNKMKRRQERVESLCEPQNFTQLSFICHPPLLTYAT